MYIGSVGNGVGVFLHITQLHQVGESVMLSIPQSFLDQLKLDAGAHVEITIDQRRLIIKPVPLPRYTLDELSASTDPAALAAINAASKKDIWMTGGPVGRELL